MYRVAQQVGISGNDPVGTTIDSGLEKHVVVWIATAANLARRFDELAAESKQAEEILNVAFIDSVSVLQPQTQD